MKHTLLILVLWTMTCGLVLVSNQYTLRQEANDPQLQIVRDMRNSLNRGVDPSIYQSAELIDVRSSLSPFVMVFDSSGTVLATNGALDGKTLSVPQGVIEYVTSKNAGGVVGGAEHRVTLEPASGVRLAAVLKVVPLNAPGAQHLIVLSARNLMEVEARIQAIKVFCAIVWLLGVGFFGFSLFVSHKARRRLA
jgi:hypothetical protein